MFYFTYYEFENTRYLSLTHTYKVKINGLSADSKMVYTCNFYTQLRNKNVYLDYLVSHSILVIALTQ